MAIHRQQSPWACGFTATHTEGYSLCFLFFIFLWCYYYYLFIFVVCFVMFHAGVMSSAMVCLPLDAFPFYFVISFFSLLFNALLPIVIFFVFAFDRKENARAIEHGERALVLSPNLEGAQALIVSFCTGGRSLFCAATAQTAKFGCCCCCCCCEVMCGRRDTVLSVTLPPAHACTNSTVGSPSSCWRTATFM